MSQPNTGVVAPTAPAAPASVASTGNPTDVADATASAAAANGTPSASTDDAGSGIVNDAAGDFGLVATGGAFSDTATDTAGTPGAPPGGSVNGEADSDAADISAAWTAYQSDPKLQQYVAQNYGEYSWMLNNPELAPILVATAYWGWDEAHVASSLDSTQWWQQNGADVANWQSLQNTDPATANQQSLAAQAQVLQAAYTAGVNLSSTQLQTLSQQAAEFNWTSDEITNNVNMMYAAQQSASPSTPPTGGQAASFLDQAQSLVQSYGVSIPQSTMNQWVNNAVVGKADIQGFEEYLKQVATAQYPWMGGAIASGITPSAYLAPYASQAESILGVSADAINWSDPSYSSALTSKDPSTGMNTPVSVQQFGVNLRTNPTFGYDSTPTAISAASGLADQITQSFGKVAS